MSKFAKMLQRFQEMISKIPNPNECRGNQSGQRLLMSVSSDEEDFRLAPSPNAPFEPQFEEVRFEKKRFASRLCMPDSKLWELYT